MRSCCCCRRRCCCWCGYCYGYVTGVDAVTQMHRDLRTTDGIHSYRIYIRRLCSIQMWGLIGYHFKSYDFKSWFKIASVIWDFDLKSPDKKRFWFLIFFIFISFTIRFWSFVMIQNHLSCVCLHVKRYTILLIRPVEKLGRTLPGSTASGFALQLWRRFMILYCTAEIRPPEVNNINKGTWRI